jgi:hypothetical protein
LRRDNTVGFRIHLLWRTVRHIGTRLILRDVEGFDDFLLPPRGDGQLFLILKGVANFLVRSSL